MAGTGYTALNSLSPMMFRRQKEKDKSLLGGTRNERWRSKSMENVHDDDLSSPLEKTTRARSLAPSLLTSSKKKKESSQKSSQKKKAESSKNKSESALHRPWTELSNLKKIGPVVACVLPSLAMDFVASALLAVGATPLITEDPADISNDLSNCKAVVVDAGAPQVILEAFLEKYENLCMGIPVVLVVSDCGVNDRKRKLVVDMLDDIVPTVITGRMGDIFAVAQSVIEKNVSPLDSLSDVSDEALSLHDSVPDVIISRNSVGERDPKPLAPVMRRARFKKNKERETSPHSPHSPHSPKACSPQISPRSSPCGSPRGAKRLIMKKKSSGGLHRTPSVLPMIEMKGQYRMTQMKDVSVTTALEHAQKLCTYSDSLVHLYETSVVTNGEMVVEINNSQLGMGNLHSTLACSGAIVAAVLSCVDLEEADSISVKHCGHALALYHVAADEAGKVASDAEKGVVSPGSLRQAFLDSLHSLSEIEVHEMAQIFAHSEGIKSTLK